VHTLPAMTTREGWAWMVRATAPIALLGQRLGPTKWAFFDACVLAKLIETFGEERQSMRRKANLSVGRGSNRQGASQSEYGRSASQLGDGQGPLSCPAPSRTARQAAAQAVRPMF